MSARGSMTMRADVERNTASGTDAYGGAVAPIFTALATVPCFMYERQGRREATIADGKKQALVDNWRGIFPLRADIVEADQIASIKNRLGVEIIAGRFHIDAVFHKHDHIEVALERIR